jgi:hypothetical protein
MLGLSSKGVTNKYRRLTMLSEDIQLAVLDGKGSRKNNSRISGDESSRLAALLVG